MNNDFVPTLPSFSQNRESNMIFVPHGKIKVLQIGAYKGDTTAWLLKNRDIDLIDDVDIWETRVGDLSQGRVEMHYAEKEWDLKFLHNPIVKKHKCTSDKFFNSIPQEETYDFIYIDGSHDALQVALDGLNAFKVLKSGGIMAFDDYEWDFEEDHFLRPKRAIDAIISICEGKLEVLDIPNKGWQQKWIRKI